MIKKTHINTITKGDNIQLSKKDFESIFEVMDKLDEKNLQLISENEQLKKQNEYLKSLKWNLDCINEISIGIQQRQYLEKENKQLKSILYDIVEQLECAITPNEDILYTHRICVIVDEEMYQKIQKILRGNFCD